MFGFTRAAKSCNTLAELQKWAAEQYAAIDAAEVRDEIDYNNACELYAKVQEDADWRIVQLRRNAEFNRVCG